LTTGIFLEHQRILCSEYRTSLTRNSRFPSVFELFGISRVSNPGAKSGLLKPKRFQAPGNRNFRAED
jgi:hypothetical protein